MTSSLVVKASGNQSPIDQCRGLLGSLSQAMQRKQWHEVAEIAERYTDQVSELKRFSENPVRLMPLELMQLELMHRRLMRNLYQYMQAAAHDIESLDHGIQHLHHHREMLRGGYSEHP